MSYQVKCDGCGEVADAPVGPMGDPVNPRNPKTNERWYSRVTQDEGKPRSWHACGRACIEKVGGLVLPI